MADSTGLPVIVATSAARVLVTLQLAQILHSEPFWAAHTRLRCCVLTTGDVAVEREAQLRKMMSRARIYFDLKIVLIEDEPDFKEIVLQGTNSTTGDLKLEATNAVAVGAATISLNEGASPFSANNAANANSIVNSTATTRNLLDISVDVTSGSVPKTETPQISDVHSGVASPQCESLDQRQLECRPSSSTFKSMSLRSSVVQARLMNAVMRRHTSRHSVLLLIHQNYGFGLSQEDQIEERDTTEDEQWIEELRQLTTDLPPVLLVSPNSDQAVTTDKL